MSKSNIPYLMESPEESLRLDIKTDVEAVKRQALWCGLKPGMRVLDAGCGSGKASSILHEMIQPGGELVAVDFSEDRIAYAKKKYGDRPRIRFQLHDFNHHSDNLFDFDLIWVRFLLEYFRTESINILKYLSSYLKIGGQLCLIDLDHNALNHYEMSPHLQRVLSKIANALEKDFDFDPYAGRKLYSYLYDLGYEDISVDLMPHHLIYGKLRETDSFNWTKKIEVISKNFQNIFFDYPGGEKSFFDDFLSFLNNPRRFTYTPLILCKGTRKS